MIHILFDSMIQGGQTIDFVIEKASTYDGWGAQVRGMGCAPTRNGVPSYEEWGGVFRTEARYE